MNGQNIRQRYWKRPEYGLQGITTTMTGGAKITEEDINKAFNKTKKNKSHRPKMELLKCGGKW